MINHPQDGSKLYEGSTPQSLNDWLLGGADCSRLCERIAQVGDSVNALPWITLVLGSELTAPTLRQIPVSLIGRAIAYELTQMDISPADATATGVFVASLLTSRRNLDFTQADSDTPASDWFNELHQPLSESEAKALWEEVPEYEKWVLRLFHAAAEVNAAYFLAKRAYHMPVNRWDDDPVQQLQLGHASDGLRKKWENAAKALASVRDTIPKADTSGRLSDDGQATNARHVAVKNLIIEVYQELDPMLKDSRVTADNLLTLTEVAWYYLTVNLIEPRYETHADLPPGAYAGAFHHRKQGRHAKLAPSDSHLSWPEILLTVGLQPGGKASPSRPGRAGPRPRLSDPVTAAKAITEELWAPSMASAKWWSRHSDIDLIEKSAPVHKSYGVYADILAAQSHISYHGLPMPPVKSVTRNSESQMSEDEYDVDPSVLSDAPEAAIDHTAATDHQEPTPGRLSTPPATLFVTTFDMEFELALHRLFPSLPFVIVLPVNVDISTPSEDNVAANVWLGYVVGPCQHEQPACADPDTLLAELTNTIPTGLGRSDGTTNMGHWFVVGQGTDTSSAMVGTSAADNPYDLSSQRLRDLVNRGPLPFVIRLAGAPLIKLPNLANPQSYGHTQTLRSEIASALEKQVSQIKSLSHALLLEESHSLFLTFPEFDTGTHQGLPPALARYFPKNYWRYWMLLGVQAADDPVRYRLVSQIAGVQGKPVRNDVRPQRAGMTLNRQGALTRQATDLLRWSYFDIVEGRIAGMTGELEHYRRHLTADPPIPLVNNEGHCLLDEPGGGARS